MLLHRRARLFLLAHHASHSRWRPNKLNVAGFANLSKVRVFREQPISRMHGVHIGNLSCRDHRRNIQITLPQLRRPNTNRLIRKPHMQRVPVRLAVNSDGLDPQFLAGADHPQGDLTAIRDQNFLEHEKWMTT